VTAVLGLLMRAHQSLTPPRAGVMSNALTHCPRTILFPLRNDFLLTLLERGTKQRKGLRSQMPPQPAESLN